MGGTGSGIPVEQDGGSGTAGSHWNGEIFGNELMTGYIRRGDLSRPMPRAITHRRIRSVTAA
jgi:hypothetical protein